MPQNSTLNTEKMANQTNPSTVKYVGIAGNIGAGKTTL